MRRIVGDIRDVLLRRTMKTPSFFYDNFYDKSNKVMTSYVRLCTLKKTVWINRVRKREVKSGYKILSLEILMMKPLNDVNKGNDVKNQPVEEMKAEPEKIDFSKVKVEPLFEEFVDFDTFSKSDFRAVKVKECVAVPKSKKLLRFTLDDGTCTDRTILSGIHSFYEPEELVGKTLIAITNLPPRAMMGIDSCGMLLSAIHEEEGEEKLHLLMVDDHIPAGAKLY